MFLGPPPSGTTWEAVAGPPGPPPPGTTWETVAGPQGGQFLDPGGQFLGPAPGQFGVGSPSAPPPVGFASGLQGSMVPSPAASYAPPQTVQVLAPMYTELACTVPVAFPVPPSPRTAASATTIAGFQAAAFSTGRLLPVPNAGQPRDSIMTEYLGREVTLPPPPVATFKPPRSATHEEMLEMFPTDIDMVIGEFMAREPLPRELIRLGPGDYVYGGERVEINVHTRAGRKPKLKAVNTRFNAGQPVSLRKFGSLFEEQFTPAPSPEKAERHSIGTTSEMKMEERRGSAPHQIMELTQGAPLSEAVLSSKLVEVERRISMQLAQQPSKPSAIENGRRSRVSSVVVPAQAPMALEAPDSGMRRDSGMVMVAQSFVAAAAPGMVRGRSNSVGAAVSGAGATGKARSASVSHALPTAYLGGSQSMIASGRERSATVPALSFAGQTSSRPSVSWRERLESAEGSFVVQEPRARSASLALPVSVPGGSMLAIAGPVPMPLPSGSRGGAIRQRSASMGVTTVLSPRSSRAPDPLGVTVPVVQSFQSTSAPMFANSAGSQSAPIGRSFTFAKPQPWPQGMNNMF